MSGEGAAVLIATINAGALVAGAYLTTRSHRRTRDEVRENTAEVRDNTAKTEQVLEQVANDHGSNMRDDLDKHQRSIGHLQNDVVALGRMFGHLQKDVRESIRRSREHEAASALVVGELHRRDEEHDRRLAELLPDCDDDEGSR